jgi:hypothetical protein
MLISYTEAQEVLNVHYSKLWEVVDNSWKEWQNLPASFTSISSKRGRANGVHDLMVKNAKNLSFSDGSFNTIEIKGMFCLLVSTNKGLIACKFKKLTIDGHSMNQPTIQVDKFKCQEEISGIELAHHLEIGYVLNDMETEISSIDIVCPSGGTILWKAEITPNGANNSLVGLWEDDSSKTTDTGFKVVRKDLGEGQNEATGTN